jgi:hypothetical protein
LKALANLSCSENPEIVDLMLFNGFLDKAVDFAQSDQYCNSADSLTEVCFAFSNVAAGTPE